MIRSSHAAPTRRMFFLKSVVMLRVAGRHPLLPWCGLPLGASTSDQERSEFTHAMQAGYRR
jgi:hypothetical protein